MGHDKQDDDDLIDGQDDLTDKVAKAFEQGPNFLEQLRSHGPYRCAVCGCDIELPGICDHCAEQDRSAKSAARIRKCLETIPERWRWASFKDHHELYGRCPERAVYLAKHALRRLVTGQEWMVVLAGASGKGKTSLACAMLRHVIERGSGRSALFVYAPKIARAYRNSKLGETPEIVDACEKAWILCIDDLGADAVYRDTLREVIQVREADQKPTIITTFLTEKEAQEAYGGGISRRMYLDGSIIWVGQQPTGPSDDGTGSDGESDAPCAASPGPAKAVSDPDTATGSSQVIPMRSRAIHGAAGGKPDGR